MAAVQLSAAAVVAVVVLPQLCCHLYQLAVIVPQMVLQAAAGPGSMVVTGLDQ
jgi:hypothetical protein